MRKFDLPGIIYYIILPLPSSSENNQLLVVKFVLEKRWWDHILIIYMYMHILCKYEELSKILILIGNLFPYLFNIEHKGKFI